MEQYEEEHASSLAIASEEGEMEMEEGEMDMEEGEFGWEELECEYDSPSDPEGPVDGEESEEVP